MDSFLDESSIYHDFITKFTENRQEMINTMYNDKY